MAKFQQTGIKVDSATGAITLQNLAEMLGRINAAQGHAAKVAAIPAPVKVADLPAIGSTVSGTVVKVEPTSVGYHATTRSAGYVFNVYAMREDSAQAKRALRA